MASRKKRRGARQGEEPELDMTSMIDVVFLLLIFFMCATEFKRPDWQLDSYLPKNFGMNNVTVKIKLDDIEEVRIKVDERNGAAIYTIGDFIYSKHNLRGALSKRKMGGVGTGVPVVIDGDAEVPFGHVIFALNEAKSVGFTQINFTPPMPDAIRDRFKGTVK